MPSMNVSLTEELVSIVQRKLDSGMYNNASEVVREALRYMHDNEAFLNTIKLESLKKTLSQGMDSAEKGNYMEYHFDNLIAELNDLSHS